MSFETKRQFNCSAIKSKDLIEITQLIDLTDKPIGLNRDEIGWSKVRANASNCICCCCNNSITLVTTDASYVLDHVPLNDIQFAQANASLQHLALSNHRKLVIIDLVDGNIDDDPSSLNTSSSCQQATKETKVVHLAAHGLNMKDIIHWRWLDDHELAILSYDALYTCLIDQQNISHPAFTALTNRSRYLSMERVCDLHQHIANSCQVTDIHRDSTKNLYAISSLYSAKSHLNDLAAAPSSANQQSAIPLPNIMHQTLSLSAALRPSFGSVPSKLSQLTNNNKSFDSLNSEHLFEFNRSQDYSSNNEDQGEICGLTQVYCGFRDRSQLIRAHAVTFAPTKVPNAASANGSSTIDGINKCSTILIAASKVEDKIRVHFVEMLTAEGLQTGQNSSQIIRLDRMTHIDFPSYIVCAHLDAANETSLHVAMITTKHGQLLVASITHGTILFNVSLTTDIISSAILEHKTQGLMVICRNGQILLVKINLPLVMKLLDEKRALKYTLSSHSFSSSMDVANNNVNSASDSDRTPDIDHNERGSSPETGLDIVISTKL